MLKGLFKISAIVVLALIAFPALGKKSNEPSQPFLETKVNREKAVEGEVLIYEVVLYSPEPNIAGLQLSRNPQFSGLPVSRSAADSHLGESVRNGHRYFTAIIDRFFIDATQAGKYKLAGGAYDIGYSRQVTMQDPFWGPYVTEKVDVTTLDAPDVTVRISALPDKDKPRDFSGAVGDFSVEVILPTGELHPGDGAFAIVTISGEGDLSEASLPNVRSIFPPELQFHSMTENRNHFVKDGKVGSEIEIECTFTPQEEGSFEIGECSFSFYNPVTRKYQRAVSDPVQVDVSASKSSDNSPTQYMDI